jgi:hypothetical protein
LWNGVSDNKAIGSNLGELLKAALDKKNSKPKSIKHQQECT